MPRMKKSAVGEGAEWKLALYPTAPNVLNLALPRFIMGQIKKPLDTFCMAKITIASNCTFEEKNIIKK
jgi:hypothetical protein